MPMFTNEVITNSASARLNIGHPTFKLALAALKANPVTIHKVTSATGTVILSGYEDRIIVQAESGKIVGSIFVNHPWIAMYYNEDAGLVLEDLCSSITGLAAAQAAVVE